jgi:putative aminopeptidase FrvX
MNIGIYKIVPYLDGYAVKWRPKWWPFWKYEKQFRFGGKHVIKFGYIKDAKEHIVKDIDRTKRRWKAIEDDFDEKAKKKKECREIGILSGDNIST